MPDPTPETTATTDAPGTDVEPTPPAAPEAPTTPAKRQKRQADVDAVDEPVLVPVSGYVRDAAHAVPLSGLLVHDPELLEAELTVEQWDQKLTEYLESER